VYAVTDPVLSLEPARVSVEPGGQAQVAVTISNPGTIVEGFDLDVVGEQPIPWVEVIPPTVSVYPQQQETALVVFSPPGGPGAPGGLVAFGVRARSQVDTASSAVAEGELAVGRVFGLQAKLTPVTSSGRWQGRHTVEISNWGNEPARLRLVAADPDQALGFMVSPGVVEVPLGGSVVARVKARTRKPMLRGTAVRLPFQVVGEPDPPLEASVPAPAVSDPRRPVVDGAFNQKPILSRAVVVVAAVVAAALVAGIVYLVTRPKQETFESEGVPPAPTDLAAAPGPAAATLSWTGVRQIEKYQLLILDPATQATQDTADLDAELGQTRLELDPETEYCFQLLAVRGDLKSVPSNLACTTTLAADAEGSPSPGQSPTAGGGGGDGGSPSPTTTGGPSPGGSPTAVQFAPDDWIAVVELFPDAAPLAQESAQQLQQQLAQAGVDAKLLHSPDQPGLSTRIPNAAWVVYVGPAKSDQEALTACEAAKELVPLGCVLAVQPAPAG
jgi:hypothetical protein